MRRKVVVDGTHVGPVLCGDCNGDGRTSGVPDAVTMLRRNFIGDFEAPCAAACDANADGTTSGVTDAVALLTKNFLGGVPRLPAAPGLRLQRLAEGRGAGLRIAAGRVPVDGWP